MQSLQNLGIAGDFWLTEILNKLNLGGSFLKHFEHRLGNKI
jgi:hypothetical protein